MTRPSIRNALLGLLDGVPVVGSGVARSIENHWPSRREREQAALIAAQTARIDEVETSITKLGRAESTDSFFGDGFTTEYTTDRPYQSNTLPVNVNGLDWTDQVTETDPTTGKYKVGYRAPLGSTVHVRYLEA